MRRRSDRLVAWDGTALDVPDTPENATTFGFTGRDGTNKSGNPQVRLMALIVCGTHAVIDAAFDSIAQFSEHKLARRLLASLRPGILLLADRNFRWPPFESLPGPAARLKALVGRWEQMRDVIARYGCPFGTLVSELGRRDDGLDAEAAEPIRRILRWAENQLRCLGLHDARELATTLFAGVQGGTLLAAALRDPSIMASQVRRLKRWIDSFATTPDPP